jgi:hypothetical protein
MNNKHQRSLWMLLAWIGLILAGSGHVPARADDGPVLIKTMVQIDMLRGSDYWAPNAAKPVSVSCWIPHVTFQVRKPIPSGARCSITFTRPDGSPWVELPCPVHEQSDETVVEYETPTGGDLDAFKKKYTTAVGTFGFKINLHDELGGTDQTLMAGKFKMIRVSRAQGTPETKNDADFSVDYDWTLPIGYLWFHGGYAPTSPALRVSTWLRGHSDMADVSGYLFYQGKMIADTKSGGGGMDYKVEHSTSDNRPTDPYWRLWDMGFEKVRKTEGQGNSNPSLFYLDKNPGEYEVKLMRKGDVVRDLKFTVGADGNVVDTGIAAASHLGTGRIVIPVKILGTQDGPWKTTAWQTDAFYGNPLTGFIAP